MVLCRIDIVLWNGSIDFVTNIDVGDGWLQQIRIIPLERGQFGHVNVPELMHRPL